MGRRAILAAAVAGIMCLTVPPAEAAPALAKPYDFDGNGYVDLAMGAPSLRVGSVLAAGGVVVLPFSKKGLSRREQVILHRRPASDCPAGRRSTTWFGYAVASADFNRDGYADLAVGQPNDTVNDAATGSRLSHCGLRVARGAQSQQDDYHRPVRAGRAPSQRAGVGLLAGNPRQQRRRLSRPGRGRAGRRLPGFSDSKVGILPGVRAGSAVLRSLCSPAAWARHRPGHGVSGRRPRGSAADWRPVIWTGTATPTWWSCPVALTTPRTKSSPGSVLACLTQSGRAARCAVGCSTRPASRGWRRWPSGTCPATLSPRIASVCSRVGGLQSHRGLRFGCCT